MKINWEVIDALAKQWFGKAATGNGYPESSITQAEKHLRIEIPDGLRQWYLESAAARDIWSLQDHLLPPDEWRLVDDLLIFLVENQSVVQWGVPLNESDSRVTLLMDRKRYIESPSVAEFALQFLVMNIKWSPAVRFSANGQLTDDAVRVIAESRSDLAFPEWHWPAYPTRLFAMRDLVIENDADTWLWISSMDASLFAELTERLEYAGMIWEFKT